MTPYTIIEPGLNDVVFIFIIDAESEDEALNRAMTAAPDHMGERHIVIEGVNALAAPQMLKTLREVEYFLIGASHNNKEEMLAEVQTAVKLGANL